MRLSYESALRLCILSQVLLISFVTGASAQTFSVLYSFTNGSDGGTPLAGLSYDGKNFYGTTNTGGTAGHGTVFELSPSGSTWRLTSLHTFTSGSDGSAPDARVMIAPDRTLVGTTTQGGPTTFGTVFELRSSGESVLYNFLGGNDGAQPSGGDLIGDRDGNIYGTTSQGGDTGNGTVYKLVRSKTGSYTEQQLYSFGGGTSDGAYPIGGVVLDKEGNLYGTTSQYGEYGYGTIYQLKRSGTTWTENILYSFQGGNDGGAPYSGLIQDKSGNFYGSTVSGGTGAGGVVFELSPSGSNWNYKVIYAIEGWANSGPFRDLVLDSKGNIYGTTHCDGGASKGTVWELSPSNGSWNYSDLYEFQGGTDGFFIFSNLIVDKNDNLYGTASQGGGNGWGDVFEIAAPLAEK